MTESTESLKRCSKCGDLKTLVEMRKQKGSPDGLSSWCILCHRGSNKSGYLARTRQNRILLDQLKSAPCMDCHRSFSPVCMDFDHVRGEKFKGVGLMTPYRSERLLDEAQKCDLVCANCHRFRTRIRNQPVNPRYATFSVRLGKLKEAPCLDCGQVFSPCCMDFDHVRGEKLLDISQMFTSSWTKVLEEVAKCDLVCANCHRVRTSLRRVAA